MSLKTRHVITCDMPGCYRAAEVVASPQPLDGELRCAPPLAAWALPGPDSPLAASLAGPFFCPEHAHGR
jgi:hypothetical protein